MTAILDTTYGLIMLYAPMIITVVSTLMNFIMIFKKLRDIRVKDDMNEALQGTNSELNELTEKVKLLCQENENLRRRTTQLLEALTKVEVKDEENPVHQKM